MTETIRTFVDFRIEEMKEHANKRDYNPDKYPTSVYNTIIDNAYQSGLGAVLYAHVFTKEVTDDEYTSLCSELSSVHTEYRWR